MSYRNLPAGTWTYGMPKENRIHQHFVAAKPERAEGQVFRKPDNTALSYGWASDKRSIFKLIQTFAGNVPAY